MHLLRHFSLSNRIRFVQIDAKRNMLFRDFFREQFAHLQALAPLAGAGRRPAAATSAGRMEVLGFRV